MKAEVTEVPASQLIPEGNRNFTGKDRTDLVLAAQISLAVGCCSKLMLWKVKYSVSFRLWRVVVGGRSCVAQKSRQYQR